MALSAEKRAEIKARADANSGKGKAAAAEVVDAVKDVENPIAKPAVPPKPARKSKKEMKALAAAEAEAAASAAAAASAVDELGLPKLAEKKTEAASQVGKLGEAVIDAAQKAKHLPLRVANPALDAFMRALTALVGVLLFVAGWGGECDFEVAFLSCLAQSTFCTIFGLLALLGAARVPALLKSFGFLTHQRGQGGFLLFVGMYYLGIFPIDFDNLTLGSLLPLAAGVFATGLGLVYLFFFVAPKYGGPCSDGLGDRELVVAVPGTDWLSRENAQLAVGLRILSGTVAFFLAACALTDIFSQGCVVCCEACAEAAVTDDEGVETVEPVSTCFVASTEQLEGGPGGEVALEPCGEDQEFDCLNCDYDLQHAIIGAYCFIFALLVLLSALRWTWLLEDFGFLTKSYGRAIYFILTAFFFIGSGVQWEHLQKLGDVMNDWRNLLTLIGAVIIGIIGAINGIIHVFPCSGGLCTDGTTEQARNQLAEAQEEAKGQQKSKKHAKQDEDSATDVNEGEVADT